MCNSYWTKLNNQTEIWEFNKNKDNMVIAYLCKTSM